MIWLMEIPDAAFVITSNPKYGGYQKGVQQFANFPIKIVPPNTKVKPNQHLADELHKPIVRNFQEVKVISSFMNTIWGADLVEMPLISKYNKGILVFIFLR